MKKEIEGWEYSSTIAPSRQAEAKPGCPTQINH